LRSIKSSLQGDIDIEAPVSITIGIPFALLEK
jgi:hypothetical protein